MTIETPLDVALQDAARARAHTEHWRIRYEATENLRQMAQQGYLGACVREQDLRRALRQAADALEVEGLAKSAAAAREALSP
jgi:hypothetical protein